MGLQNEERQRDTETEKQEQIQTETERGWLETKTWEDQHTEKEIERVERERQREARHRDDQGAGLTVWLCESLPFCWPQFPH